MKKTVLTIATGKNMYLELAINLARSFFWGHPGTSIKFKLVTDNHQSLPPDLANKVEVQYVKPGEFGSGFSPKLHLDKLANDGQTLFIDSDCLIFDKLDIVFEQFNGRDVSVVGGYIEDGEWFGNISAICKEFNLPHIPKFNGGLYYLEKGEKATLVYNTARELESRYDKIGFTRLRNRPNDEVLMALAMQLLAQKPVIDDGTIMSDPQACPGPYKIDVIKGNRRLTNPRAPDPLHQNWYPFEDVSPVIVHFLGHYTLNYPYKREVYRLAKAGNNGLNTLSEINALLTIQYPEQLKNSFKKILRPIYHLVFGARKIKPSERIV